MSDDVSVDWLIQRVTAILRSVADTHGDRLYFDRDYFWSIGRDQLFEIDSEPQLSLGSVSDAIELLETSQNEDGDESDGYELSWVAAVLNMIAVYYPDPGPPRRFS